LERSTSSTICSSPFGFEGLLRRAPAPLLAQVEMVESGVYFKGKEDIKKERIKRMIYFWVIILTSKYEITALTKVLTFYSRFY
jgi:hypothetical protein